MLLANEPRERYERISRRVREDDLKEHVVLLDSVPRRELPGYLLAANCVVVPSISEGFGYSALEAATLGCRVISTMGHAVEEVLAGGVELVPPRDADALAAAILNAARSPRGPEPYPQKYTEAAHTQLLAAAYERLISSTTRSASEGEAK
jgi:glycosyltransferase involved in cell wall biosynthesis